MVFKNLFHKSSLVLTALAAFALTSCEGIYDNREDCVRGVQLKFVYDYHMEPGANSFPANVDCIDVYVFDNDGNYLNHFYETSSELQSEHYRMVLPLAEGDYQLMVYGGMACEKPAFEWEHASRGEVTRKEDLSVNLPLNSDGFSAVKLHDIEERTGGLFYGTYNLTVTNADYGTTYTEHTVHLMKDTNNIQVILQELSSPFIVDYNDFEFAIIDDNFKLDHTNDAVHIASDDFTPHYRPYTYYNQEMGYVEPVNRDGAIVEEDETRPVQVGCVEFSTSRLLARHMDTARLVVKSKKEGDNGEPKVIMDIPVIKYLAATRGFGSAWIKSDQEYLDRQSSWNLMLFLQHGRWINVYVAVNSWMVRLNNIELGK